MKKMILAALMLGVSACSTLSTSEKTNVPKELFLGKWVCVIKYDDIKVTTTDISDFKENGEIYNKGMVFDTNFSPITLSYETKDQGKWSLSGNRLTIDFDSNQREVSRASSQKVLNVLKQKEFQDIAKYEKAIFNMLSNKDKDDLLVFQITDFKRDYFKIKQDMGKKSYEGECLTIEKWLMVTKHMAMQKK